MMLFKCRRKNKNHLNSMWDLIVSVPDHCLSFYFVMMSYKFPSYLHISPIFNGVSIQMEGKRNTEEMPFKWSLLNSNIGTIYHKSMERNLKGIIKNILFKCKWNGFKMHFCLLRGPARDAFLTNEKACFIYEMHYFFIHCLIRLIIHELKCHITLAWLCCHSVYTKSCVPDNTKIIQTDIYFFKLFLFTVFLCVFYDPSSLFHPFWTESIVRWRKNVGFPRKTTWPPTNRNWLVSHGTRVNPQRFHYVEADIIFVTFFNSVTENWSQRSRLYQQFIRSYG